jgi:hypothetical protein
MKYCKDCKHYVDRWLWFRPQCGHPDIVNKVTAKPDRLCEGLRNNTYSDCGPFGQLFVQAEPGVIRKSWTAILNWVAKIILRYV